MKNNNIESVKNYLMSHTGSWVGEKVSANSMKMITRYNETMIFSCEYDGESREDEFVTSDINKALGWLYAEKMQAQADIERFLDSFLSNSENRRNKVSSRRSNFLSQWYALEEEYSYNFELN